MLSGDGERSQGHNSIIAAPDGRTYLVYHTRFQNSGEWFQDRVHQVFQNEDGWLVAAPFEYTGEEVKSDDITQTQQVETEQIPGTYQLLIHRYGLNHQQKEVATPIEITLHTDGTVSGEKSGKWQQADGTSYFTLTIGNVQYKGVMVEQTMEPSQTKRVPAFTALAKNGVTVWGYRTGDSPDGIDSLPLSAESNGAPVYDLSGRRIKAEEKSSLRKGIHIQNGRKVSAF